ncbi:hypothetical protein Tco_0340163 [Tanacetum coccineum]
MRMDSLKSLLVVDTWSGRVESGTWGAGNIWSGLPATLEPFKLSSSSEVSERVGDMLRETNVVRESREMWVICFADSSCAKLAQIVSPVIAGAKVDIRKVWHVVVSSVPSISRVLDVSPAICALFVLTVSAAPHRCTRGCLCLAMYDGIA